MANPVYIGTFEEVLGSRIIGGDGCFAEPFVQLADPSILNDPAMLETLNNLKRRREYWLNDKGEITWRVPDVREAIRAPKGKKIFSADYSQIECKIMAWLSQDPFFLAAINSGKDLHSYMACEIFGYNYAEFHYAVKHKDHPLHKLYSSIRSNVKTTTFGIPYGASAKRIAIMTGMTEEEAEKFILRYFDKASVLKSWLDELREEAVENRCSRSPRGRIRWYEVPPRKDPNYRKVVGQIERFAGNHPIQAGCVDMLKPAMAFFYLALRGNAPFFESVQRNGGWASDKLYPHAALLLAVHDELVGECDEEDAGTTEHPGPVPQLLKLSMEQAYNDLTSHIKKYDDDGRLTRQEIFIRDIPNKVDVVVNDYWSKD